MTRSNIFEISRIDFIDLLEAHLGGVAPLKDTTQTQWTTWNMEETVTMKSPNDNSPNSNMAWQPETGSLPLAKAMS